MEQNLIKHTMALLVFIAVLSIDMAGNFLKLLLKDNV